MAKKTSKPATQKKSAPTKKETKPTKPVAAPPKEEVIEAEVVDTPMNKNLADVKIGELTKGSVSGLDANHRVELNGQIIDLFVKNPNAANRFGVQTVEIMTDIAAIGVITAVADETVNGNSLYATTMKREAYSKLLAVAENIGVKLPSLNALPPAEDGKVTLEAKNVKVSKDTAKSLKEEKAIVEKAAKKEVEMDPVKVASLGEDALKDALEVILITGLRKNNKSIKDVLVEAVDFMIAYRSEQYKDNAEKKQEYVESPMYAILNDIFSIVRPVVQLKGIGQGMKRLIENEKSPLSAFIILRDQLLEKKFDAEHPDEEIKACWDEQSIADTVRALVELVLDDDEKRFNELLKSDSAKDKAAKEGYQNELKRIAEIRSYLQDISFDIVKEFEDSETLDEQSVCAKAFTRLMKSYYPKESRTPAHYPNLNVSLAQRAGNILNLFRNPGNKNPMYCEANILPIGDPVKAEEVTPKVKSGVIVVKDIPFCYRYLFEGKYASIGTNPKKD